MLHKKSSLRTRLCIWSLLIVPWLAHAEYDLNLPQGVSSNSREIYDLHMLIFWVCVVIAVLVFGIIIYTVIAHRRSRGAVAANFHSSTTIEIIWTVIPLVILVAIAIPATKSVIKLENTDHAEMTIKVTGYQWKWHYEYLDNGVSFFSNLAKKSRDAMHNPVKRHGYKHYLLDVDNRTVVPVGTNIRFLMTSKDVIHSWWVPDLGVKQDANPGFINDTWVKIDKEGVYRGQCAELCGALHAFMPIVIEAVSPEKYRQWVNEQLERQAQLAEAAKQAWSYDQLMAHGKDVYDTNCAACHGADGKGVPGVFPALTGSPLATGDIKEHIQIVLNGKIGTAMQAFKTQLSDQDIAAVVTYERNALGNTVGDSVQPKDVKALR